MQPILCMEITQAFGQTLYQLRKKAGLTQEELADLSGHHTTYISLIERGRRKPTIPILFDLAMGLRITPHQFIKLVEDKLQ